MKHNIFLDGMIGFIVGDALGVPVEFTTREELINRPEGPVTGMEAYGTHFQPAGTWSDDTSMALVTLESLLQKNDIDPEHIMQGFEAWYYHGEFTPYGNVFDFGGTCAKAITRYHEKNPAVCCGVTGEHANGNGALMRVLPLCLYLIRKTEQGMTDSEAIHALHIVAGLTHNHLRSHTACGIYFFMIRAILALKDTDATFVQALQTGFHQAAAFYTAQDMAVELSHYEELADLIALKNKPIEEVRSSGYVVDSLLGAVWGLVTTDSFRGALLAVVNLGHDTDTVAAIAGGLAGLWYGYDSIPKDWVSVIADLDRFTQDCEELNTLLE